jgi:DNA repair protein RecO (recombination protein O)
MVIATKAIVLKKLRYSDHSFIVHLFTQLHGHVTTSITINSRNKSIQSGLLPLSLIEAEMNFQAKKPVQRLKTISLYHTFQTIPFNPVKSAIAQFLCEVYFECVKTDLTNEIMYQFIESSIKILDIIEENIQLFHLKNLLDLSRIMGFKPTDNYSQSTPYLHIAEGTYTAVRSRETTNETVGENISILMKASDEVFNTSRIDIKNIGSTLDAIVSYYSFHIATFKKPKSMDVFKMLI